MAENLRVSCVQILPARESIRHPMRLNKRRTAEMDSRARRKSIFVKITSVPLLSAAGMVLLSMSAATHSASGDDELWSELKGGGKVVLMRHAPVERGADRGTPLLREQALQIRSLRSPFLRSAFCVRRDERLVKEVG